MQILLWPLTHVSLIRIQYCPPPITGWKRWKQSTSCFCDVNFIHRQNELYSVLTSFNRYRHAMSRRIISISHPYQVPEFELGCLIPVIIVYFQYCWPKSISVLNLALFVVEETFSQSRFLKIMNTFTLCMLQ